MCTTTVDKSTYCSLGNRDNGVAGLMDTQNQKQRKNLRHGALSWLSQPLCPHQAIAQPLPPPRLVHEILHSKNETNRRNSQPLFPSPTNSSCLDLFSSLRRAQQLIPGTRSIYLARFFVSCVDDSPSSPLKTHNNVQKNDDALSGAPWTRRAIPCDQAS